VRDTLSDEIVANAISAATSDPRFEPVREAELSNLRYSVDVLFPAEHAEMKDLDPAIFGVIVEDESGSRRGLLLPDIPGIDDAEQQVEIAARKAGISHGEPIRLFRFKVERFREHG
jgi:AMMECR1 domain-containing protein